MTNATIVAALKREADERTKISCIAKFDKRLEKSGSEYEPPLGQIV